MGVVAGISGEKSSSSGEWSRQFLDDLASRIDLSELVSAITSVKPVGEGRFMARCPFHEEKSPSFSINTVRGLYHCFGCGAGGDIYKFVMETEKVGFADAVRILARKAGVEIPSASRKQDPYLQALRLTAELYQDRLRRATEDSPAAKFVLARDITQEEVRQWGLGLSPDSWDEVVTHLRKTGISDAVMLRAGVAQKSKKGDKLFDRFRNRFMFPIHSSSGTLIGFGARNLDGKDPKYLNSPESQHFSKKHVLYGLDKARREIVSREHALIVEGYTDVISMHRVGQKNTIAPMGTAFSREQASLLLRFTDKIKLLYDRDEAGRKAQERSVEILLEVGFEVKIAMLPVDTDPDDLIRRSGSVALGEVLKRSVTPVEYFLNPEQSDISARREYGKRMEQILASITDTVYRGELFEEYARLIKMPKEHIPSWVGSVKAASRKDEPQGSGEKKERQDNTERLLCHLIAYNPDYANHVIKLLGEGEVTYRLLAKMITEMKKVAKDRELDKERLAALWGEMEIMEQLAELANDDRIAPRGKADPYKTLIAVKEVAVRRDLDEVKRQQEETSDDDEESELRNRIAGLNRILNTINRSSSIYKEIVEELITLQSET